MTDKESVDSLEDFFSLVGNDIRLDILRTLWDSYTDDPSPAPEPVPFSTLKNQVGVRDSGQFHYHLDELVPVLVTHQYEGYTLTYAGARIVAAGYSGVYTNTDMTLESQAIDECSNCSGTLELRYEQGHAVVNCDSCNATHIMSAPPILVGAHDVKADPELFGTFTMTQIQQTIRGFCYLCSGPVEGSVADSSLDDETGANGSIKVAFECTECGTPFYTTATTAVLDHPSVVSLLDDAGIDYREIPVWRVRQTLSSKERIRDADPIRVEVAMTVNDDELTIVLNENLDVVDKSRT